MSNNSLRERINSDGLLLWNPGHDVTGYHRMKEQLGDLYQETWQEKESRDHKNKEAYLNHIWHNKPLQNFVFNTLGLNWDSIYYGIDRSQAKVLYHCFQDPTAGPALVDLFNSIGDKEKRKSAFYELIGEEYKRSAYPVFAVAENAKEIKELFNSLGDYGKGQFSFCCITKDYGVFANAAKIKAFIDSFPGEAAKSPKIRSEILHTFTRFNNQLSMTNQTIAENTDTLQKLVAKHSAEFLDYFNKLPQQYISPLVQGKITLEETVLDILRNDIEEREPKLVRLPEKIPSTEWLSNYLKALGLAVPTSFVEEGRQSVRDYIRRKLDITVLEPATPFENKLLLETDWKQYIDRAQQKKSGGWVGFGM